MTESGESQKRSDGPNALVVTSVGSSPGAVTAVLAALEAVGVDARALDLGRVGARSEGAVGRVVRAVLSEFAERRLTREWSLHPPDVAVAFDPGSCAALLQARDEASRPAPVVAIVPEITVESGWGAVDADRYLAVDSEAAAALGEDGVEDDRVVVVGPLAEAAFVAAGNESASELRARFKIPDDDPVVLVEVDGFGYERTSQVALQLSLTGTRATYLFAAGGDAEAAAALRSQVPTLDLRAKLFGNTADAPLLWRTADVVVAEPSDRTVARVLAVGARMVSVGGGDGVSALGDALVARRRGAPAATPLLISGALEPILKAAGKRRFKPGADGAGHVADIVWLVGKERGAVIEERRRADRAEVRSRVDSATASAEAAARASRAPGELEDLGSFGGGGFDFDAGDASPHPGPDPAELRRLRKELEGRKLRLSRTISDARKSADSWEQRRAKAEAEGASDMARHAERNADLERARMHQTLAELAEVDAELARLGKAEETARSQPKRPKPQASGGGARQRTARRQAPRAGVDDALNDLKRRTGSSARAGGGTVEDELEALKRKMAGKERKR